MSTKKLARSIIGTVSSEIRTVLVPMSQLIEKMENGDHLTSSEINKMRSCQDAIMTVLTQLNRLADSNFDGISYKSDKLGLCFHLVGGNFK